MKIYINWDNREIITETKFFELCEEAISEYDYSLNDFLSDNYMHEEVFYFDDEQKQKVINKWKERIDELVFDSLLEEWEEYDTEKI